MLFYIWFTQRWRGRTIGLKSTTVLTLFPSLPYISPRPNEVDIEDLITVVKKRFPDLRSQSIFKDLKDFLRSIEKRSFGFPPSLSFVENHILRLLSIDKSSRDLRRWGISRARCNFAVLARFAEKTDSTDLAIFMVQAFWKISKDVITYERDDWLHIWFIALTCLRSVHPRSAVDKCIGYLCQRGNSIRNSYYNMGRYDPQIEQLLRKMDRMMDHMDRGRNYDRQLIYPRARTLPPPVRTAVPMLMPAPAWTSAYASPAIGPYDDHFRDAQIEDMMERLDQVEFNQQVQGEQLGLMPPSPMASLSLPWYSD